MVEHRIWWGRIIFVLTLFLYSIFYILNPSAADAATGAPQILNHQGRLLNASGTLLGGAGTPYCFRFSFYDDATPGGPDNKLWPTGSPTTTTAMVRSGIFNVGIGDTSQGGDLLDFDFQSTDATYLNVDVATQAGGACGGGDESFETLSPRQRIYSSGYAINANKLSGYTAAQTASGTQIPVLTSGNLVLGGTNPQVNATGTNALILQGGAGTGNIQFFNAFNFVSATGTLMLGGQVTALNINQFLTTTSSPTFAGITVSGPAGLQSFTFTNAPGTGNLEIATLSTTGAAALNSLTVSNVSGLAGVTFSNATGTGNLRSATLDTTGAAALNSLAVTNGSVLQGVTFANATGTGNLQVATLNTTGAVSLNSLSVVGTSGLQGFTFTNATGTGNFQVGTFTATGVSSLQGLTFANATSTGNLQAFSIVSQNIFDMNGNNYVTSSGGFATGPTGSIQYNDGGIFAGSQSFIFATSTQTLNLFGTVSSTEIRVSSGTVAIFTVTGQSTLAAVSAASLSATGNVSAGSFSGAGLSDCAATNSKLLWNGSTQQFECSSEMSRAFVYNQTSTALALTTATSSLGVNVTITPSASSSLVLVRLNYKPTALSSVNAEGSVTLIRGTAETNPVLVNNLFGNDDANTESPGALIQFIDAPATTSPVTYSAWGVWGTNGRMQIDFRSLIAEEVTSSSDLFAGGGAGANPGGPSGSVQYNDGGIFAGSPTFMFDANTATLNLYGTASSTELRTASATIATLLDSSGNKYVTSTSGSTPGGPSGSIQYNDGGIFTGSPSFIFATSTQTLNFFGIASSTEIRSPSGTISLFNFSNATGTTLSLAGPGNALQVTAGTAALQGLTFTNATGTGNFQAGSINNTPIGNTIASTGIFTNATTTGTFTSAGAGLFQNALTVSAGNFTVSSGVSSLQGVTFTNATGTGNLSVATLTTTGAAALDSLTVSNGSNFGPFTFTNATGTGSFQVATFNTTGNVDFGGILQAGSSDVNLTLNTGYIDAGALPLSAGPATATTFSTSGLEVASSGLSIIRGCNQDQILKWDLASLRWECQDDMSGGVGSGAITVKEGETTIQATTTVLSFSATDFTAVDGGPLRANVSIDYASSGITRRDQNETVSGEWSFFGASTTINSFNFTNATGTGNFQAGSINNTPIGNTIASTGVFTNATTTGTFTSVGTGLFQDALTVSSGNFTVSSGVSSLQGVTFTNATSTGNLSVGGILRTGSSNIVLTLATGFIDANSITLAPSGVTTATSSITGLQVATSGLSLVRGCSGSQVLKWNLSVSQWECADDQVGVGGGGSDKNWLFNGTTLYATTSATGVAVGTTTASTLFTVATTSPIFNVTSDGRVGIGTSAPTARLTIQGGGMALQVSSGLSDLQDLTFTNATGTGTLTVQGAGRFENGLTVSSGATSLQGLTFANATGTGNVQVATMVTTGEGTFNSARVTNSLSADTVNATSGLTFSNATGTNLAIASQFMLQGITGCTNGAALGTSAIGTVGCFSVTPQTLSDSTTTVTSLITTGAGSNLKVEITTTPPSASSSLLVTVSLNVHSLNNAASNGTTTVYRGPNGTSTDPVANAFQINSAGGNGAVTAQGFSFLDSPATSSPITYSVFAIAATVNRIQIDRVTIIVQEVTTGADLAEVYPTNDNTLLPGSLVELDSDYPSYVRATQGAYGERAIGVVSTKPALLIGADGMTSGIAVPVALAGRVPVLVNTENGPVISGDYLVPSSVPGVAMKATRPSQVIAQAMSGFDGAGTGTVIAFIKNTYYGGGGTTAPSDVTITFSGDDSFFAGVAQAVADFSELAMRTVTDFVRVVADVVTAKVGEFVNLFASVITIVPDGSIVIPAGDNEMSGGGFIPALTFDVLVSNTKVSATSKIFLSPIGQSSAPLYIKEKIPGVGFRVGVGDAQDSDVAFDWIIFESYNAAAALDAASAIQASEESSQPDGINAIDTTDATHTIDTVEVTQELSVQPTSSEDDELAPVSDDDQTTSLTDESGSVALDSNSEEEIITGSVEGPVPPAESDPEPVSDPPPAPEEDLPPLDSASAPPDG